MVLADFLIFTLSQIRVERLVQKLSGYGCDGGYQEQGHGDVECSEFFGGLQEALQAGMAPRVNLQSTHISTLEFCDLADLKAHSVDDGEPTA